MTRNRNRKIVKYRKPFQFNIGVVFFVIIFLYLLYNIFTYFTTMHISVYEVKQGKIAQNTTFQGLILRDETVYYAADSGYINYYYKDGSKANVGSYVYSVDETGSFYEQMAAVNDGQLIISDESYEQLDAVAGQYLAGYSDANFQQVYQYKYDMEAALVEALNTNARNEIGNVMEEAAITGLHAYRAEAAGVVAYNTDGLENVDTSNFTADMFNTNTYQKENFLKRQTISAGDAVYKMINSEIWHVVIPISAELKQELAEEENIKVEFKKDNTTAWALAEITSKGGQDYLILEFKNSMIRFASERFVELELLVTDTTGLKIPNSSITTKDFITVPKEYITKGGDSNANGLLIEYKNDAGENVIQFIAVSLFYETEDSYYIDSDELALGNVVIKPDSNERYTLQNTETLEGVYNINKGYAVFKRINKLFENEEYTIVESGTSYGIALYDHIALDSSAVQEDDLIK